MNNIDKQDIQKKIITDIENTPSNIILRTKFIERMTYMNFDDIKKEFCSILVSSRIKDETRNYYMNETNKSKNKNRLMEFICNFIMAAEKMSTNLKKYSYR